MANEHAYRYAGISSYSPSTGLLLATTGGREANPFFFRGFVERADQVARGLLAVGEVARTRYLDARPSAIHLDPVVTSNRSVLRFESFSTCNGVYARLDVDEAGFDAELADWGTTNVDMNEPLRAALSTVGPTAPLRLSVGTDALAVETLDHAVIERKVPLPIRWLKGFGEVQVAAAEMVQVAALTGPSGRVALRDLLELRSRGGPTGVVFSGGRARLTSGSAERTVTVAGPHRLASLRRLLPYVETVEVYASPPRVRRDLAGRRNDTAVTGASAWVVGMATARLTLVLSPSEQRGFSGEGRAIEAVASADTDLVDAVASTLEGQARLDITRLGAAAGEAAARDALVVLGAGGRVGFDLTADGFFHRDLPFDRAEVDQLHPRLIEASRLVERGAVHVAASGAAVDSGDVTYRIGDSPAGRTCTCPWFVKHGHERGACKHVLAAVLAEAARVQPA